MDYVYSQIEDFNMVQFLPLDVTSEESVGLILSHIDNSIQYGEAEVRNQISKLKAVVQSLEMFVLS